MQKTANFTGIRGISEQDMAMTQGMGPIYARWNEHLGSSDVAVIAMRRVLMRHAQRVITGGNPVAAYDGSLYRVRALETRSAEDTLEGVLEQNKRELAAVVRPGLMDRRGFLRGLGLAGGLSLLTGCAAGVAQPTPSSLSAAPAPNVPTQASSTTQPSSLLPTYVPSAVRPKPDLRQPWTAI